MITGEDIVNEARTWLKTPFHHGGMCKGAGADCIGIVAGSALNCGCKLPDRPNAYPLRANGTLRPYLESHLVKVDSPKPGDILLMSFDNEPHHLALYCGETMIHAYAQVRKCVEHGYDDYWKSKVTAIYRLKEIANG